MNRHYNIICGQFVSGSSSKVNVDITKLDSIINHSASSIYCSCFNYLNSEQIKEIYNTLIEKLAPECSLTIELINTKNYARLFALNKISGAEFYNKIGNLKSFIGLDDIYVLIDNNTFKIIQSISEDDTISITIERIKI